jgi:pyruvate-formate lyase-activating enzyme
MIAKLTSNGTKVRCDSVTPIGEGHFVFGADNAVFGNWNSLAAVRSDGSCTVIPAHGGEIIPGRLEDHISQMRRYVADGDRTPVQVDFDVSMACPSACPFCFSADYRATRTTHRMLARAVVMRLIRSWARAGVRVVRFDGGGDPLTHPALLEAIELCGSLGMRTALLTAGDLLSTRQFAQLLRARTYVRVSLNAATDETRRAIHARGHRGRGVRSILDTLARLAEQRAGEYGSEAREQMPLGATSMVHPANVHETVDIAREAREAGLDHLSFRVVLGAERRVAFTDEELATLHEAFALVRKEVAGPDFKVFIPTRDLTDTGYRPSEHFGTCIASTHRALVEVGPDAETAAIVPCGRYRGNGFRGDGSTVFGVIAPGAEFSDVWMGQHMRRLLPTFPDACGDCIDRSANLFLGRMAEALREDPRTTFIRFSRLADGCDASA